MSTEAPTTDPIAPAQNADDLLAQMADEEVHRMLADAENGATPAAEAPLTPPPEPEPEPIAAPVEPAPEMIAPPADPPPVDAPMLDAPPVDAPPADAPTLAVDPAAEVAPPIDLPPTPAEPADSHTHPPPESDKHETPPADAPHEPAHAEPAESSGETPVWIKPLVWINAPLANQSDTVRSFIGWAAVMTLANSIAVLAYVYLTRRNGH